jgi:hypothetical protein
LSIFDEELKNQEGNYNIVLFLLSKSSECLRSFLNDDFAIIYFKIEIPEELR